MYTRKTWAATMSDLRDTFEKWGVRSWEVLPRVGLKRQSQTPAERTVTVTWTQRNQHLVVTLGQFDRDVDNLRAIYNSIEAMRLIEARGVASVVREILAQLPPPSGAAAPTQKAGTDPYAVLGVSPELSLAVIEATWKAQLLTVHPDRGGSTDDAARLNAAMAAIRKERQSD